MKDTPKTKIILCALLVILVYGSFNVILENGFITFDDPLYIVKNQNILSGFSIDSLKWAFQTTHTGNWIPLTWLSHMLDVELFGDNPGSHHRTNLIIHCINALLVFLLLDKMTRSMWASFLAALLFSIHPLRVESVAWVSERKDVLCALFGLLSIGAYVSYTQRKTIVMYCLTGIFLILGLMSKSMLVTWPFVFLLLDYWPLQRLGEPEIHQKIPDHPSKPSPKLVLLEKIPFVCIAFIFCVIAYQAQKAGGAVANIAGYPLALRIENPLQSYLSYLKLIFFPHSLGLLYPLTPKSVTLCKAIFSLFTLLGLTSIFFCFRKQKSYLWTGWLWFLGTLVPVLGLVQIGTQSLADRYTYIPGIGISIMIAFLIRDAACRGRFAKGVLLTGTILVICTLIFLTQIQCSYWKDSMTLYRHTLNVTDNNYIMHINYGDVLANNKQFDDALVQFQQAHEIIPVLAEPLEKMAYVNLDKGNYQKAVHYLRQALTKKKPEYEKVFLKLGLSYSQSGQTEKAIDAYHQALQKNPSNLQTLVALADIYKNTAQYEKSLDFYNQALNAAPQSVTVMNKLSLFYAESDNPLCNLKKALKYAQQACQITNFKDKNSLITLIQLLEQDKTLEHSLSREFLERLNLKILELKGAARPPKNLP